MNELIITYITLETTEWGDPYPISHIWRFDVKPGTTIAEIEAMFERECLIEGGKMGNV